MVGKSEQNKHCLRELVVSGKVPGILAYKSDKVIGWFSIAPRTEFPKLDRSPTLKRIDDEKVWSITCFVIAREYKRRGIATALTHEAMQYAQTRGAKIIEAYPLLNERGNFRNVGESFMGFVSTFERLVIIKVSSRSEVRNIMRYYVDYSVSP